MQVNSTPPLNVPANQSARWFLLLGVLLLGLWAWSFWPTLVSMEQVWRGSETYMHCYFIPFISAWLIWPLRHAINTQTFGSKWGLCCLLPSLLVWLLGFAADINLIAHFGVMFCLISLLWCWLGDENFKLLRFPLLYLLFAVPFGDEANAPLQFITAEMAVWLLQHTGIPVLHEGLYITTPVASFEVAEACSGVRFMIVAMALAFLFSHLHFQSWKKRVLFISALAIMSIIANSFRAFFLIFIGEKSGMTYGFGADHYYYGWAFFAIVIFLSFHIGAKFGDKDSDIAIAAVATKPAVLFPVAIAGALLLALNATLSSVWQPVTPPEQPAKLTTPSRWQLLDANRLHPTYPNSLASSSMMTAEGLQYFAAHFANRQSKGELVSWDNQLFPKNFWQVTHQRELVIATMPLIEMTLSRPSGERLALYYTYQVGDVLTTDVKKVKLLQAFNFITLNKSPAILHHFNCLEDIERCRQLVGDAAAELITTR